MKKHAFLTGFICFLFIFALTTHAISAESNFPSKDIRMISPWDAGGGADAITRTISFYAQKYLLKSIFVENITGAMSAKGVYEIMRAPADGYTLGQVTYDSVITVPRQKLISGYDLNKLEYLCNVTREGFGTLIVLADSPWKNLADLVADAKKRPKQIKIGYGATHLPIVQFERLAGIEFKYIPYAGSNAQNEALLMGEVDAIATSFAKSFTIIESKKARAIATPDAQRNPKGPDCPTFREAGYDVIFGTFTIIATTAGTPPEHLKILRNAFHKATTDPGFIKWAQDTGLEAYYLDHEETKKFVERTQKEFWPLIDDLVSKGLMKE